MLQLDNINAYVNVCFRNGNGNYSALCRNCNGSGHMARDCPEGNKQSCYNCGEQGHLSRECRKRN